MTIYEKIKYYLSLAIKKPHLIKVLLYHRHIGLILSIPIESRPQQKYPIAKKIILKRTEIVHDISKFYEEMNRNSINEKKITKWLEQGHDCYLVFTHSGEPIAGMWVFKKQIEIENLSGYTLTSSKKVVLDEKTLYGGYVIVNENHRGKGINNFMLSHVIEQYVDESIYKNMLMITGVENFAFQRSVENVNGKVIGLTKVINLVGIKLRNEIFINQKHKNWK